MRLVPLSLALATSLALISPAAAKPPLVDAKQSAEALELCKTAIGYRTVQGQGMVPAYAQSLKQVLIAGGFAEKDVVIEKIGETATLVARYRGTGKKKPMLLSGHMDVVEAKAEGFKPSRDIILALSGDEETDMLTSQALAKQLAGAEFALNADAGGGVLDEANKPVVYALQAGEKTYADFDITITNPGGHSSRPNKTNAIYDLAKMIDKIGPYQFAPQANELTRAYLKASGLKTPGELGQAMLRYASDPSDKAASDRLSAEPEYIGQVRTTCVATMLRGGHALNALPQAATVSVNCRIMPGVAIETIRQTLTSVIDNPAATITVLGTPSASDASPLRADIMAAVRKAVDRRAPGLPIEPNMSAFATDSLYFRAAGIPSYGVSGTFMRPSDDFAHGLNERAPLGALDGGLDHWHTLILELAK
jgi:acetylornithine deacetylase/succinyl-diaminopimelate desuccinylase-like protein